MCKRAASRLGIDWPASPDDQGEERDLYDGKILPSRQASKKQVMPAVLACMKEMKRFWDKPFRHRVPVKGFSSLEVADGDEWGLGDPPVVEQVVASHLHPSHWSVLAAAGHTLPSKMERFSASMYQKMYKSAAQSVKNLNVITLLTAYQVELFQEMGLLLDKGSPSLKKWEEICVVAKGLFGEAVTTMQQTSDLRKKQGEAFDLCLPRKITPRPTPPPRQGFAATVRGRSSGFE